MSANDSDKAGGKPRENSIPQQPPNADRQKAVALKYKSGDAAPRVVAKGQGYVAERILENAERSDVPIYKDKALTEELTRLDLGENIPPELYEIVAQVLIYVSDLDKLEEYKQGTNDAK